MPDDNDDPSGFLDGRPVRLSQVPPERRADFEVLHEGARVRPLRFVSDDGDDSEAFRVVR